MDYFSTIVIEEDANDMFNVGKFWRWSKQTRRKLGISIKYIGFEEIVYD